MRSGRDWGSMRDMGVRTCTEHQGVYGGSGGQGRLRGCMQGQGVKGCMQRQGIKRSGRDRWSWRVIRVREGNGGLGRVRGLGASGV